MVFKHVNTIGVKPFFESKAVYEEESFFYYEGFHLMSPRFFDDGDAMRGAEYGCQYLLALNAEQEVIGILKWKRYGIPNHDFISEEKCGEEDSYIGIRFIDVESSNRRKGIALSLVKHWSQHIVRPEDKVVGGKATEMGRQSGIHDWMKRELSQSYYLNEGRVIEEWEENNEEYDW